jgi:two-component system, OmpR family, sensor histidine kinase TctE
MSHSPRGNPGLSQRLVIWIALPMLVVLAISVFFDFRLVRETVDDAYDHSLADAALDIASHINASGAGPLISLSTEAEEMLRSDPFDTIYFSVMSADGRLLAGDKSLPTFPTGVPGHPVFANDKYLGKPVRMALLRAHTGSDQVTVTVAETMKKRDAASRKMLTAMLIPSVALILAALVIIYFGVRRGLAPLNEIESEIARRSPRDLRPLDLSDAPREIHPMLYRLNELFDLLREATAAQERFLADAAHQLRTPLAGLQTQVELAVQSEIFCNDPGRLSRIEEAMERLGHLIRQLLLFARSEPSAAVTQTFRTVALNQVTEDSANVFIDQALAKNIDLGYEISEVEISGVDWMLREALGNLIDNAINYTPVGGSITVRCHADRGRPVLSVEDSGPGIPAEEHEKVFDRFYRIPDGKAEGCGLGLAIVKEIADIHGATIRLGESDYGGLSISLLFPSDDRAVQR